VAHLSVQAAHAHFPQQLVDDVSRRECAGCFLFVLCVIVPDSWCGGPSDPGPRTPVPPGPMTLRELMFTAAAFVWFVSALGLFFRSRLVGDSLFHQNHARAFFRAFRSFHGKKIPWQNSKSASSAAAACITLKVSRIRSG
jgi:hypothetical protein